MDFYEALMRADDALENHIHSLEVVLVAHVLAPRGHDNSIQLNCPETEHFTVEEFKEIYQGIVDAGFFIKKVFFSEFDFINDIIAVPKDYASAIVFNLCRNGVGMNKKVIVPAICDLLGIRYTSSGAGQCALARNKWMFSSLLHANGIACPASSLSVEDMYRQIPDTSIVICKPNSESASQGVDERSIVSLKEVSCQFSDNIIIQEYIDGYECEVPIFCVGNRCFALPPVGIAFRDDKVEGILSYSASMGNDYAFYNLSNIISEKIIISIMRDAEKTFSLLELQRYGRVDFRIDKNTYQHYVIDIATTPYITKHSSFAFAVSQCHGKYSDIYKLILAASL